MYLELFSLRAYGCPQVLISYEFYWSTFMKAYHLHWQPKRLVRSPKSGAQYVRNLLSINEREGSERTARNLYIITFSIWTFEHSFQLLLHSAKSTFVLAVHALFFIKKRPPSWAYFMNLVKSSLNIFPETDAFPLSLMTTGTSICSASLYGCTSISSTKPSGPGYTFCFVK